MSAQDTQHAAKDVHWHDPSIIQSEDTSEFWPAFVAMQADLVPVAKDQTTKHYKYASLDSLIETVRPILAKHDLGFVQVPSTDNDMNIWLTTMIIHRSGQYISSKMRVVAVSIQNTNALQQLGGGLTYARRYALSAMLGLSSDEDTDAAHVGRRQPNTRSRQYNRTPPPDDDPADTPEPAPDDDPTTFVSDRFMILQAHNSDKIYQMFIDADDENRAAAWWKGRDALADAAPWITLFYSRDQLHDVGQTLTLPDTEVHCERSGDGKYLNVKGFELAIDAYALYQHFAERLKNVQGKIAFPALPPDLDQGIVASGAWVLRNAVRGLKHGRDPEDAQAYINNRLEDVGLTGAIAAIEQDKRGPFENEPRPGAPEPEVKDLDF